MDLVYALQDIEFEWDTGKAEVNLDIHGVRFEEAAEAFLDPFHLGGEASRNLEYRQWLLGYSQSQRLLLVVHCERGERIRLISARPATRAERRLYDES